MGADGGVLLWSGRALDEIPSWQWWGICDKLERELKNPPADLGNTLYYADSCRPAQFKTLRGRAQAISQHWFYAAYVEDLDVLVVGYGDNLSDEHDWLSDLLWICFPGGAKVETWT